MKKIIILLLCSVIYGYGFTQITDSVSFPLQQIKISTQDEYVTLSFADCSFIEEAGAPKLPYIKFRYVIPINKRISHISLYDTVFVSQILSKPVYPVQPVYPVNETPPAFVMPDSTYYNANFPNQMINVEEHFFMKGYHVVTINLYPIQYNGTTNTIKMAASMKFTLHFENNEIQSVRPKMQSDAITKLVKEQIRTLVKNTEQIDEVLGGPLQVWYPQTSPMPNVPLGKYVQNCPPEYLIITNNTFLSGEPIPLHNGKSMTEIFQELADWKTQKGIPTAIYTLDEIISITEGCDTEEKIHNFLKLFYENCGTAFVLFGGNISIIPSRKVETPVTGDFFWHPSDLYFTAIENNWNANGNDIIGEKNDECDKTPEFWYGRTLVNNGATAQIFVDKVLQYEKMTHISNKNYVNNLLFVTAYINGGTNNKPIPAINDIVESITQPLINKWRLYDNYNHGNNSGNEELNRINFINNLNNGQDTLGGNFHLVYHQDHSGYTSLGASSKLKGEKIFREDMDALDNGNCYHVLYTNGCNPGDFEKDCIIANYLNNPHGGGVAAIASSTLSAHGEEYIFENLINAIYPTVPGNPSIYKIGMVHDKSISPTSKVKRKNHLFGDPEMPVWTRIPVQLNVSYTPSVVSNTTNQITVTVSNLLYSQDITVCLLKDNEIYQSSTNGVQQTSSSKTFTFNVEPQIAGNITLTVTGHNYLPYQSTIPVTITGKNVYVSNTQIMDFGGNNNGKIDAGETVNMNITLRNNGTVSLSNVTATLSCLSDHVTMITSTCSFGNMSIASTVSRNQFQFKVDENIPDGVMLKFKLTIIDNSGYSVARYFNYQVNASDLQLVQNNLILSGNDYDLFVDIHNAGSGYARNVSAMLSSTDISIIQPLSHYGIIAPYALKQNTVAFKIPASYTNELLALTLTDFYGKETVIELQLTPPSGTITGIKHTCIESSIRLTWNRISQNCKGYNVYRSEVESGNYVKLNNMPIPTVALYIDVEVNPLTNYYYKVSYVDLKSNESALSAPYMAMIYPIMSGFPVELDIEGRIMGSVNVEDVTGDGTKEIFATIRSDNGDNGYVIGLKADGTKLFPATLSGFATLNLPVRCTPAIGKLEPNGVHNVLSISRVDGPGNKLFWHSAQEEDPSNPGNPKLLHNYNAFQSYRSPIIADLNNDGFMETIFYSEYGNIGIYDHNGNLLDSIKAPGTTYGALAVADLDGDGKKEIIGCYYNKNTKISGIYIWKHDGTNFSNQQPYYTLPNNSTFAGYALNNSVIVCDLNNNGKKNIVTMPKAMSGTFGYVIALEINTDGIYTEMWHSKRLTVPGGGYTYEIAVGDLDNDGLPEVVVLGLNRFYILDNCGNTIKEITNTFNTIEITPILADIDGEPGVEIIYARGKIIDAYKMDGTRVSGFMVPANIEGSLCVADIDNCGKNELIAGSGNQIYVWKTNGSPAFIEWGCERANPQNTGEYLGCRDITITTNETWTTERKVCGNITVAPGATLTIKNTTLYMTKNASITIQSGGKLTIDGSTITNPFNELWQGITVMGLTRQMGVVQLTNNGKIKNARCAITVNSDGWVAATDAHFVNNTTGVFFKPQSGGTFKRTNFELNDHYPGESGSGSFGDKRDFLVHIKMHSSGSVTVEGCDFSSTAPKSFNYNKGIEVLDAGLEIKAHCPTGCPTNHQTGLCWEDCMIKSRFSGFGYAVSAVNTGTLPKFKVGYTIFEDNYWGIFLHGANYPEILKNDFIISHHYSYGLEMGYSTGYRIEENLFRDRAPYPGKITIGSQIVQSGTPENEIYKNNYENMYIAQWFIGKNSSQVDTLCAGCPRETIPGTGVQPRITGLQTLCNIFDNSTFWDIRLGNSNQNNMNSIRNHQGTMQNPAGNEFNGNPFYNIDNYLSQHNLNYFYDVNAANSYPTHVTGNVFRTSTTTSNGCPSKINSGGISTKGGKVDINRALAQYDEWNKEYAYYLDYLTPEFENEKEYNMTLDMISYLSGLKENYYNSLIVAVMNEEEKGEGQKSPSNIEGVDGEAGRGSLYENLRYLFSYRGAYSDYLSIIESYLAENNYRAALSTLNNMSVRFKLIEEEKLELEALQTYIQWRQQLHETGKNIYELTEREVLYLLNYVKNNIGRGVVFAKNILCVLYNICIEEEGESVNMAIGGFDDDPEEKSPSNFEGVASKASRGSLYDNITLHPNPTTGKLRIESGQMKIENIEVYDAYSRNLLSSKSPMSQPVTIDISHLQAGIYFIKIATEAGKVVKKVVKQ